MTKNQKTDTTVYPGMGLLRKEGADAGLGSMTVTLLSVREMKDKDMIRSQLIAWNNDILLE